MDHTTGDDYQDYYRKVELQWSLARGRQIIVSPIEFEEIERWYESGVPLPVVLRAIDLFVEKKNKSKRKRGYLLKDAGNVVDKCHREYREIHAGEGEETDLLASKMKALIRKVKAVAKAWPDEADFVKGLCDRLGAIKTEGIVAFDAIDAQLDTMGDELVLHFAERMSDAEREEIREDVSEFLSEEEDPEFFAKMFADAVRTNFALPKFTLLG